MLDNLLNTKDYGPEAKAMTSDFFVNVYSYMFMALGISGTVAYITGTETIYLEYFIKTEYGVNSVTPLFYLAAFAPFLLVLLIRMGINRFSMATLLILYGIFSVLMGFSLSSIFVVYDIASIASTFAVTSAAFGTMAVVGYTTKTDLTKMGSLLYMLLVGMIVATIIQIFVYSDALSYVISLVGVVVFTGLTAYQMQQLKYIGEDPQIGHYEKRKLALIGGLQLYMLFINLFLTLLRLLGSRD